MTFAPVKSVMEAKALGMPISVIEQLINSGQLKDPVAQPELPNIGQPVPPAPMEAAMGAPAAPQQPQGLQVNAEGQAPPISGIEQAMMGEDFESQAIAEMPNAPPQKKLGLLGRIQQKPGGSRALLALGASLLSNKDFFSGLGQGAMAYQGVLDEEAEKLKEKNTLVADGRFISRYDPKTGKYVFERTPYADFDAEETEKKLQTQVLIGNNRNATTLAANDADNQTILEKARLDNEAAAAAAAKAQDWDKVKFYEGEANKFKIEQIKAEAAKSGNKPSVSAMKEYDGHKKRSLVLDQTGAEINKVLGKIESGALPLNMLKTGEYKVRAVIGAGNAQSTNYQELTALMNKMTLAITQSSVGVQTNFDYAKAELQLALSNNDEMGVKTALRRIGQIFKEEKILVDSLAEEYKTQFGIGSTPSGNSGSSSGGWNTTSSGVKWKFKD